ncbi:outer membrane protein assembly factor BamA [Candidatus Desulfovibrio trichonymphae]|uniref:Outer membrane protein assembly factor BamA n=1 Tax=Candidatus Desulfovibrio trichonymphae TaxID=1725232 RepID=A0A1J1DP35_9BACT|nr:outer membrane protein assembly factor BamA [Candidatus Desulfovibrio trichonymphae]BAV91594.1 outer membrane protein assembly complex, YaeT protein [Candidatus Desulfovibrio trichonymphae]GHU98683.1 OMP85 family outer membrane protein [Deltaproteobacteria bacterium]
MKKGISNALFKALCYMTFVCAMQTGLPTGALGAPDTVLILPFQANAGPEMPNAAHDVPQLIATQLEQHGLSAVPMNRAAALVSRTGGNINLAAARDMGRQAGASLVIYGSFNQLGDGFALDTRIVPVNEGGSVPAAFERGSLTALTECADAIADRAAGMLNATERPAEKGPAALIPMRTPNADGGIADVQIRGMKVMDPDIVLMRMTIRKGDKPDANAVNEEVKRIWDMGYFSDVQAGMEGNVLVFTVKEKPRIDNIMVEGSHNVDKDDVLAAMSTKTGSTLNEQLLSDDLQKITEMYRKEGYYLAKAAYRLEDRAGGQGAVLVISVTEGNKLYIKEVKIDGLKELKQSDMKDYMALRPHNLLSWFTGTGTLKEEYLERDTNAIAAFGLNEGFVDIQVAAPLVEYKPDGIHIAFNVQEGQRYAVRDVKFAGDVIDSEENMLDVIEMDNHQKSDKYFSLTVMQEDSKRLTDYYADYGYAFAEVDTRVIKADDGSPLLDVGYIITKKQKVFIRRLTVEGNVKTRDNVILREMRFGDGDMYEGAKLRRSTERLNHLRYFSAVDTELIPTGQDDEVDLKVKVKETNTGALMGGIGYSTYYDVGLTASIMERNLFGRGYWLQLQGFFSWRRTSGMLSFTNPRLYDTDLSVGNDLYYIHDYWDDFTKDTLGDTIRFAYPIGEYTSVGVSYRLERYDLYDVSDNSSPYISDYKGTNWTSAISGRILRDTTDFKERPTKGTIARLWAEYGGGGLGGTDNFVKAVADWQGFWSFNPQNTIHVRGRLGGVFQNTDEGVPVFERFWLGGMDTIRGYSYSDISPRDYRYGGEHVGGDRMGVFNLEYIWTFEKEIGLALVPFLDGGFNIDQKTMGANLHKYFVYSTGLELRWRSPMGDLRIAYGIPLSDDYDKERESGRLEFSMGQFF